MLFTQMLFTNTGIYRRLIDSKNVSSIVGCEFTKSFEISSTNFSKALSRMFNKGGLVGALASFWVRREKRRVCFDQDSVVRNMTGNFAKFI